MSRRKKSFAQVNDKKKKIFLIAHARNVISSMIEDERINIYYNTREIHFMFRESLENFASIF